MDIIIDCNMYHISQSQSQTVNKSTIANREVSNHIAGLYIDDIAQVSATTSAIAAMNETSAPVSTREREEFERRKIDLQNNNSDSRLKKKKDFQMQLLIMLHTSKSQLTWCNI